MTPRLVPALLLTLTACASRSSGSPPDDAGAPTVSTIESGREASAPLPVYPVGIVALEGRYECRYEGIDRWEWLEGNGCTRLLPVTGSMKMHPRSVVLLHMAEATVEVPEPVEITFEGPAAWGNLPDGLPGCRGEPTASFHGTATLDAGTHPWPPTFRGNIRATLGGETRSATLTIAIDPAAFQHTTPIISTVDDRNVAMGFEVTAVFVSEHPALIISGTNKDYPVSFMSERAP